MADIVVNVRTLQLQATGVQRYTAELVSRLAPALDPIAPRVRASGVLGHVWEQTALPLEVGKRLLWSPAGTGPWSLERQVVTIHDAAPLDHPEWFGRRFAHWYRFLQPRLLARARRIITVSNFSRARLAEHVPAALERIFVIPLGKSSDFQPAAEDDVAALRARLRLETPYLLVVGSLQPRKNLARLLSAWRRVRDEVGDVILALSGVRRDVVFGDAGFDTVPGGVRLLGWVDDADLPALYTGAHAFVYPSLYEGFGLPPLEAMACGTAVVTSNSGSLPEVVGDAAMLVDPWDIDSIADGVRRISTDEALRERLRDAGFSRAKEFSWERAATATSAVLYDALENGVPRREAL